MITAIHSVGGVHGAEIWVIFCVLCAAAYFGICAIFSANRVKSGMKEILLWGLVAGFATDLIWALLYYQNGDYINHGIGAAGGLIILPVFLAAAGIIATAKNKRKI